MINSITPVGPAPQLLRSAPAASAGISGPSFKSVLLESMEQTRLLQGAGGSIESAAAQGAAMMQKAELALSAATQVHQAMTRAYDDIQDIYG